MILSLCVHLWERHGLLHFRIKRQRLATCPSIQELHLEHLDGLLKAIGSPVVCLGIETKDSVVLVVGTAANAELPSV